MDSARRGCRLTKLAGSGSYYRPKARDPEEPKEGADLRNRMEAVCLEFPRYGHRRVTRQLQQEGWRMNRKRLLRTRRESDLLCRVKRKGVRATDSKDRSPRCPNPAKGVVVTRTTQVRLGDITYIRIPTGFVYLVTILDAWSRKVMRSAISTAINTSLALEALRMAVVGRDRGPGVIHHSDQGVQYASTEYTIEEFKSHGPETSMATARDPYENAQRESFFKTLKCENVYPWEYRTLSDVMEPLPYFLEEVYD